MISLFTAIVVILLGLILPGVVNRVRAVLAGRKGVHILQHIYNTELQLKKGTVYSPTVTPLFKIAPSIYLASVLVVVLMMPIGGFAPLLSFHGDIIMFCYLLALGRVFIILGAMDTGSSFQGMGASREALYGALLEPALFVVLGTLAISSNIPSFSLLFQSVEVSTPESIIVLLLVMVVLVCIFLVECGRIPVVDSRTHLELTMIHEVMALDYGGVDMAMINIATWLKGGVFAVAAANVFSALVGSSFVVSVVATLAVGVVVGFIESFRARFRQTKNATFIFGVTAIALLMLFVAYLLLNNIKVE